MLMSELQIHNEFSLLLIISSKKVLCLRYISVQYSEQQACVTAGNDVGMTAFGTSFPDSQCVIFVMLLISSQIIFAIVS